MIAYIGFVLAAPLFLCVQRLCGLDPLKQMALFDVATKFFAVISCFLYLPLSNFLIGTVVCQDFGDGIRVLRNDHSIECGNEPQCLGAFAVFFPLHTVGFPILLLAWMRQGFSDSAKKKLSEKIKDSAAYDAKIARYNQRFGFFTDKYESFYW